MKIRIGVLCPSEIAFRRFMPAIKELGNEIEFVGVAHANELEWFGSISENNNKDILKNDYLKATNFVNTYGGIIFNSFMDLITSNSVDAVYIPLPPALHYKWTKVCLENGKHVLVEKPSTTTFDDTNSLVEIAKKNNLALHENYMFKFHNQINQIMEYIRDGKIGKPYLYRLSFGFPFRGKNDFRYNKKLGGGALLDCGGYTIKLAKMILGDTTNLNYHNLVIDNDLDVDIFGFGVFTNHDNEICEVSFGMNNEYKCDMEVWGSKGYFITTRIFTAPSGFVPQGKFVIGGKEEKIDLNADDTFKKSIEYFVSCVNDLNTRKESYDYLLTQAKFIDAFRR